MYDTDCIPLLFNTMFLMFLVDLVIDTKLDVQQTQARTERRNGKRTQDLTGITLQNN